MATAKSGTSQAKASSAFENRYPDILDETVSALNSNTAYDEFTDDMQERITYVVTMLQDQVLLTAKR
ncbi:MAG: hypothetical protein V8R80_11085 [Eubacterium sp.]